MIGVTFGYGYLIIIGIIDGSLNYQKLGVKKLLLKHLFLIFQITLP